MAMAAMPGCELLVDFDRSKIPTEDASLVQDGGETPDAPASADAPGEGNNTVTNDARTPVPDATVDGGGADSGDSAATAPETSTSDTGADVTNVVDTGTDSGPDAVVDAALDAE
jgi:hypothetical protein